MNLDQFKRAIAAKLKDKSNMEDWFYERFNQCVKCEFNSGNREKLSFKDRLRLSHNFGKDACLKCTCGIEDKTSDPMEQCPLEEPKWFARIPVNKETLKLNTKDDVLIYNKRLNHYVYEYGDIDYSSDSKITVNINTDGKKFIIMDIQSSCGCTTPSKPLEWYEDGDFKGYCFTITYDTKRRGNFSKLVSIKTNDGKGNRTETYIKIKGNVKRK